MLLDRPDVPEGSRACDLPAASGFRHRPDRPGADGRALLRSGLARLWSEAPEPRAYGELLLAGDDAAAEGLRPRTAAHAETVLALLHMQHNRLIGIDRSGAKASAAIERIVGLLRDWSSEDEYGVHWPGFVSLREWAEGRADPGTRPRPSWCYGVPGVSRAVQLAALALGRDDWHDLARASVLGFLASPRDRWSFGDTALCHGWSGLLHLLGLLNRHIDDERLTDARDEIVDVIAARFDDDLPFGLRFTAGADSPGFLEGSGGVALALDAYAEDRSVVGWDEALLVA